MQRVIRGFEPDKVFEYFEQISAIPRSSGEEERISGFLVNFAKEHGLDYYQDDIWNVIIKKPASKGYEGLPAVALQGHMDMVCEKNSGTVHDFTRDPIKLTVKDGRLCADGTTLGTDNGIAVAMMLAVLADDTLWHPPLECIFTVMEETGLTGAAVIDGAQIKAAYMINLDAEEEGIATVSCCGGIRIHLKRELNFVPAEGNCVEIAVGGLAGGHSGMDIHRGRANANKLMARVLTALSEYCEFNLASMNGGNKDNAIPRECRAVVVLPASAQEAAAFLENTTQAVAARLVEEDNGFTLTVTDADANRMLTAEDTRAILTFMNETPNGVLSRNAEGFIESSINFASINTTGTGIECVFSARSVFEDKKHDIVSALEQTAAKAAFTASSTGDYPGWAYDPASRLRELAFTSYRELFNSELEVNAIHAGLECGLFKAKNPALDIVAIGPNVVGCHTPSEYLDLASCNKVWQLLLAILKKLR